MSEHLLIDLNQLYTDDDLAELRELDQGYGMLIGNRIRLKLREQTQLKEIIRKELLKEDDYATQYVDMIDDITKEVTRKSSKIVKLLNKQDKITGTKNARVYNQAVDKHFRNFIATIMKITAKIED